MVEFKVENGMKILRINMKNGNYPSGRMIKPSTNVQKEERIIHQ